MQEKIKIAIVDDHKLFRQALTYIISQVRELDIIGEASNGRQLIKLLDEYEIDVVLLDLMMPGFSGIETTKKAIKKSPDLKIIVLTMFSDSEYYYSLVDAGISGYILKDSGKNELLKAIYSVVSGEKYFSQKLIHNIISSTGNLVPKVKSDNRTPEISDRLELDILKLICLGNTNSEISEILSISQRKLEVYKSQLISKTGVKDSVGLAIFAVRNNLVDL